MLTKADPSLRECRVGIRWWVEGALRSARSGGQVAYLELVQPQYGVASLLVRRVCICLGGVLLSLEVRFRVV